MAISYLDGQDWQMWSREERFFCAVLYNFASLDPGGFASWIMGKAGLASENISTSWDLGYEVCLYRDVLWNLGYSAKEMGYPHKRTFDLCLFGDSNIVIIEAKVCEKFNSKQNCALVEDKDLVAKMFCNYKGVTGLRVNTIGLASGQYWTNAQKHSPVRISDFDGIITWKDVYGRYPHDIFVIADDWYKKKRPARG